jgi:hypothetical protein
VSLPPGLQTTWNQLSHHLGNYHQIPEVTTRTWRLALSSVCSDYSKQFNNCQMVPPSPSSEQGMTTGPATTLSTNLHQVGDHFIEAISEVDPGSLEEGVDPDRTEDPNQRLQTIRFKATIRGWSHRTHQHRVTILLNLQNEPLGRRIREFLRLSLPRESLLWVSVSRTRCLSCRAYE